MNAIKQLAYRFRARVYVDCDLYNEDNCYAPFQEVHDAIHETLHIKPSKEGEQLISLICLYIMDRKWKEFWISLGDRAPISIHEIEANVYKLSKSPHYKNIVRRLKRNLPIQRKKWNNE